jgi:hypothetical protein
MLPTLNATCNLVDSTHFMMQQLPTYNSNLIPLAAQFPVTALLDPVPSHRPSAHTGVTR